MSKILNITTTLYVPVLLCVEAHSLSSLRVGMGGGGHRPVDLAIGDGKNVSVNVTALSVPFSRKGSSPQAA